MGWFDPYSKEYVAQQQVNAANSRASRARAQAEIAAARCKPKRRSELRIGENSGVISHSWQGRFFITPDGHPGVDVEVNKGAVVGSVDLAVGQRVKFILRNSVGWPGRSAVNVRILGKEAPEQALSQ